MNHREASLLLVDFTDRRLDERTRHELISHVKCCTACQGWLHSYDLLEDEADKKGFFGDHPESDLLAKWLVRPEDLDDPSCSLIERHIELCAVCQRDIEMVRTAVLEAKPDVDSAIEERRATPVSNWWKAAAAACIASMALWLVISFESRRPSDFDLTTNDSATHVEEPYTGATNSGHQDLAGLEIDGTRLIETAGSLTLSKMKINDGANVTILAGGGVTLGNGFQIGSRALVEVGVSPGSHERDQPQAHPHDG